MSCQYLASGDKVCCTERVWTERTQGVWTSCDECGHDWWCVVGERDWMDEPVTFVCSGGCEDGFPEGYFDDYGDGDESGRADWSLPVALACLLGVVAVVVGGLR